MENTGFRVWHLKITGEIESYVLAAKSFNDVTRLLPEGVYTTLRTYESNKVIRIREHFRRLMESSLLLGRLLEIDYSGFTQILRVAINENCTTSDIRIRIHLDISNRAGELYLLTEKLQTPSDDEYINGVAAITRQMHRNNAKAKSSSFIQIANEVRGSIPEGINEVLMIGDQGEILEGLSSNFFAVINRRIYTAEEGVLQGITRGMVLEACSNINMDVIKDPVNFTDQNLFSEAFITSASRGVLPLSMLNGINIGNGMPGHVTNEVTAAYNNVIINELEVL